MVSFRNITDENETKLNPEWPQVPDNSLRILVLDTHQANDY